MKSTLNKSIMKNKIQLLILTVFISAQGFAQVDKEQLALAISKADDANTEKLKEFIWKRKSDVSVGGQLKLTTITEFSFDDQESFRQN
jgi:hypothetical protein